MGEIHGGMKRILGISERGTPLDRYGLPSNEVDLVRHVRQGLACLRDWDFGKVNLGFRKFARVEG